MAVSPATTIGERRDRAGAVGRCPDEAKHPRACLSMAPPDPRRPPVTPPLPCCRHDLVVGFVRPIGAPFPKQCDTHTLDREKPPPRHERSVSRAGFSRTDSCDRGPLAPTSGRTRRQGTRRPPGDRDGLCRQAGRMASHRSVRARSTSSMRSATCPAPSSIFFRAAEWQALID